MKKDREPTSQTQRIVDALTAAIVERRLMPGTKLVEQKIADIFSVSRTIVRQALNQLSRDRLVVLEPARGAFVATPSVDEARQVFEVRSMLEAAMVRSLCERITERTGIPASTAILSLNALLKRKGITRLALVSPYTEDVQNRIIANYRSLGVTVVAELHENIRVNHDFALVDPARLEQMIIQTCASDAQAVSTYCTNLHAAQLAEQIEKVTGVPLLDTVSTTIWGALTKLKLDPAQIKGWGQLYQW